MKRRNFLKTLGAFSAPLVAPPSTVLECADRAPRAGPSTRPAGAKPWEIANDHQRILVTSDRGELTYQSFIRDENGGWKTGSMPLNQFVTGPSFRLKGSEASGSTADSLRFQGTGHALTMEGSELTYAWSTEITSLHSSSWFRFSTTLRLPRDVRLQQGETLEPQIILWLSSTSTMMEGQSASWRRILLEQPTRNSLGTPGNDLPAVYLQDANAGVETLMYFDLGSMGWMSLDNIPRFLGYRCSTVSALERNGNQRLGIGLIANQATGNRLPGGEVRFTFYLLQRRHTDLITEQQAVRRWMEALLPLFEEKLTWPPCATSWKDFAAGAIRDLQQKDVALISVNGHSGLRAYVKATSELWHETGGNFELMTLADVLWPSLLYLKLHPNPDYQQVVGSLLESLPSFYHKDTRSISNDFIRGENEAADSWYPFENSLIKYPMIGALSGSDILTRNFLDAYNTAIRLAHRYEYLFPIYYRTDNLDQRGAGTNYAVGGLYAWGGVIAHRLTREGRYLEEARRAVEVLATVRASSLFHEPQELAFGALAAAELGMDDAARYLIYEQLRMFYWSSDPSQKTHDIRGMVQAAASILYPAFKENVEAILPWTGLFKRGVVVDALLRFMDQQRRNDFYYFDACRDSVRRGAVLSFIPYENLGTLELGGQTGNVGKEIYGSGEILWLYLMFEAMGTTNDRELMFLNLDLLDLYDAMKFPPRELNFILFNPTDTGRSAEVSIPVARGAPVRLKTQGRTVSGPLTIAAGEYLRIQVEY